MSNRCSDEQGMARDYYERVGYHYLAKFEREEQEGGNPLKSPGSQVADLNCHSRQFNLTPGTSTASQGK